MAVLHRLYAEKLGASSAGSFIGNAGEIFYDPDTLTLRISDGTTPGGRLMVGGGSANPTAADVAVVPSGGITTATVQAALAELDAKKLPLSGGTMTGELILTAGTPVDPNAAVSKDYVQGYLADTIATGGITSNTVVFDNTNTTLTSTDMQSAVEELFSTTIKKAGDQFTGPVTTTETTFANNAFVTAEYVNSIVNTEDTFIDTAGFDSTTGVLTLVDNDGGTVTANFDGRYLQLSGGTMTGDLILPATTPTDPNAAVSQTLMSTFVTNTIASGGVTGNTVVYDNSTSTLTSTTVEEAINELDANKVDKAGDTMTGFLTLFADPIAPLQAATKDYVDSAVTAGSGASLLDDLLDVNATTPVNGSTLRYDLGLSRWVLGSHVDTAGDTMTGALTLSADPTAAMHAATKQYVDASALAAVNGVVDSAPGTLDTLNELAAALGDDPNFATTITTSLAGKVDKAGDTMTGALTLPADPTAALEAATKQYVDNTVATEITNTISGGIDSNTIVFDNTSTTLVANNVQEAVVELDANKVDKAGDTMTGFLTLHADPTAALEAATKQYVDTTVSTTISSGIDSNTIVFDNTNTTIIATDVQSALEELDANHELLAADVANLHISDMADVDSTGVTNGQVLSWDGVNFTPFSLPAGTTDTFTASGVIDGNTGIITFTKNDSSTYAVDISAYGVNELTDLVDVVLPAGAAQGDVLTINGSGNYEFTTPSYPTSLGSLSNVDSEVDDNHGSRYFLTYSTTSSAWVADTSSLEWLEDVNITSRADGDVLVWDGSAGFSGQWISQPPATVDSIGDLSDVLLAAPQQTGDTLIWDGTRFRNGFPKIFTTTDTSLNNDYNVLLQGAAPTSNLNTDAASKITYNPGTTELKVDGNLVVNASDSIDVLADVDTTTAAPTDGQVLTWDNTGSAWVPQDVPAELPSGTANGDTIVWDANTSAWVATEQSEMTFDTTAPSQTQATVGDFWYNTEVGNTGLWSFDGTNWLQSWQEGSNVSAINDLTDVNTVGVADGEVLTWNNTNGAWEAAASGGVAGPGVSTDNAIARFDGTTGQIVQDSGASIDDAGKLTAVGIVNDGPWAQKLYDFSGGALGAGSYSLNVSTDLTYAKYLVQNALSFTVAGGQTGYAHSLTLELIMNGGSFTFNNVTWPGGSAPTLTDNKTHMIMITTSDGGATFYGSYLTDY